MRRLLLFFFSILILIAGANAQSLAYEGFVFNGKNFIFDQNSFSVIIGNSGNTLVLRSDGFSTSLSLGECFSKEYRKYCYNSSVFEKDSKEYKGYVYIYYLKPRIEITKTVSNNILSIGESASFSVNLANTGDIDAEAVVFSEELPEYAQITDVKNAMSNGQTIYFEGKINKGEDIDIKYTIKSIGEFDKSIKSSVKYFDGKEDKVIYSDSVRLYSTAALSFKYEISKEDFEINEEGNITVTIENKANKKAVIDEFYVNFPDGITVKKSDSDFTLSGKNKYNLKDTIEVNETRRYVFAFSGYGKGAFFISGNGGYTYENKKYAISSFQKGFVLHSEDIEVTSSLASSHEVNTNELLLVYVHVKNKNSFSKITDVIIETKTDAAFFDVARYHSIGVNETALVLNAEIRIPDSATEISYPVVFNVSYSTGDGERHSMLLERSILAKPVNSISLSASLSEESAEEKSPVDVKVTISNNGLVDFKDIFVKATVPKGFTVNGPTSTYVQVNRSESKEVMSFTIIPDIALKEQDYKIKFSAEYKDGKKNYETSVEKTLRVLIPTPIIGFDRQLDKSPEYKGELSGILYTITNNDIRPVFDLTLAAQKSLDFDTYNLFTYNITKLNPGEKITFRGEDIIVKAVPKALLEKSTLVFKDEYKRSFSVKTTELDMTVSQAQINGPAVFIIQKASKTTVVANEILTLHVNITSIGLESAKGRFSFNGEEMVIANGITRDYEKNISFDREGIYVLPRQEFNYTNEKGLARAYSNEIRIEVRSPEKKSIINPESEKVEKNKTEASAKKNITLSSKENGQKKGFFDNLFSWLRSLFIKEEIVTKKSSDAAKKS